MIDRQISPSFYCYNCRLGISRVVRFFDLVNFSILPNKWTILALAICWHMLPLSAFAQEVDIPIHGIVRASNQAEYATDLVARVVKVAFKEGERFTKGQLLIAFDCRMEHSKLAAVKAAYQETKLGLDSAKYLQKRNAGSKFDLEVARARTNAANADVEAAIVLIDRCKIFAPYDGSMADIIINEHEMSIAGKPLFKIVNNQNLEIELIVPSGWARWLKAGEKFKFTIDETKTTHDGIVVHLGPVVDAVSQTIKLYATLNKPVPNILPGMSGIAKFKSAEKQTGG